MSQEASSEGKSENINTEAGQSDAPNIPSDSPNIPPDAANVQSGNAPVDPNAEQGISNDKAEASTSKSNGANEEAGDLNEGRECFNREFQHLIQLYSRRRQYHILTNTLTEKCWDMCIKRHPHILETRQNDECITNCVEKFLDCADFIVKRMDKKQEQAKLTEEIPFK